MNLCHGVTSVVCPQEMLSFFNSYPILILFRLFERALAMSSSPRPWIDVFALSEKSNMVVTESDPDPKV